MQEAPPDILITNYSMLNIMLMRSLEGNIFDSTAQWLAQDRRQRVFHLVVDELHSYRGTPGTEVGYLLRTLLDRLGLTPDSPQLGIIATSASIENDADSLEFLEQFFGRDRNSFEIINGDKRHFPDGRADLPARVSNYVLAGNVLDSGIDAAVAELTGERPDETSAPAVLAGELSESGALEAVRRAGDSAPLTVERLAQSVF